MAHGLRSAASTCLNLLFGLCLQVRAASLSQQPLTSVALLPSTSGGGHRHPLVLCGAFDACVHAYSADSGRQLGSWQAAGDAVACVQVLAGGGSGGGGAQLVTAAWDGSIRLWDVAEGRAPWGSGFAQPSADLLAPSGVWALAASTDGSLVLAGAAADDRGA